VLVSLRSKRSCAFLAKGKPRNLSRSESARVLAGRKMGRAQKMKRGGRGKGGKGTLASNHCESQILLSPANGASDWFKIGQMIEARLLLGY